MSYLKKTISRALRGPKPTSGSRWVTTLAESIWNGERYVTGYSEGYWYEGAWSLAHNVSAVYTAPFWRFRNDDGSEATATDIAAENVDVVKADGIAPGDNIRIRIAVGETAGAAGTGLQTGGWTLQFNKNAIGWTNVGAATNVKFFDSSNLVNGTAIATQRLSVITGATFASTHGDECEDGLSVSASWSKDSGEIEYSIQFDAVGTAEDDSIDFRLRQPDGTTIQVITGVPNIILAAVAAGPDQTADGAPSITPIEASGSAELVVTGDGSPSITPIEASGSAEAIRTSDGSPSIQPITAAGDAEVIRSSDGSPSINPIVSAGDAKVVTSADGSPSIQPIESAGVSKIVNAADGAPSIQPITAAGDATVIREATGGPSITPITAAGVCSIIREALGSLSISPVIAAGNAFIWPKVWLNTSQTLLGATEMTVTAVEADGTGITFSDPVGAPTGSVFLGVENRDNGDVGWIAVTVTVSLGPTVIFGSFGA